MSENPAPDIFHKLTHLAQAAMGRLKVSSALNPCLWLCGIVVPSGLVAAIYSSGGLQIAWIVLVFVPIVLFAFAFIYFVFTDPDKLRSEEYELRKQALEMIEEKGGRIPLTETSITAITNPDYKLLDISKENQE